MSAEVLEVLELWMAKKAEWSSLSRLHWGLNPILNRKDDLGT